MSTASNLEVVWPDSSGVALVTNTSFITGERHQMKIKVTPEQVQAWRGGVAIQKAMPHLNVDEREFFLTGMTNEEWDKYMADEDDDE